MRKELGLIGLAAGALAMALSGSPAGAQDYPSQPITIVVGYPAGGGTDVLVRAIADRLSNELGTSVLVQNVGGAGGGVAAAQVARTPADGYTLIATTSSTFTLEPIVQQTAYTPDDFTHVALIGQFQGAIFAPAEAPFDDFEGMVEYARENGLNHGSFFQLDRLLMNYVANQEDFEMTIVPVDGGNGAVQAVLAGTVDTAYSGGSWMPYVASGDAKVIFATSYDRLVMAPDLVSMKDLGYDIGTTSYITLSGPAGLPDDVIQRINELLPDILAEQQMQDIGQARIMEVTFWDHDEANEVLDFETNSFREMFETQN